MDKSTTRSGRGGVAEGRPRLSNRRLREALEELFGIQQADIDPLPSDRDQNALVTTPEGERFVLKVASLNQDRLHFEAQCAMMAHLRRKFLAVPEIVPALDGSDISSIEAGSSGAYLMRLVRYLEGTPLAEANPRSSALLRKLGRFLGDMDRALTDFDHPGSRVDLVWDVRHARTTVDERRHLLAQTTRDSLDYLLERTEPLLQSVLDRLQMVAIHGDANDHNILFGPPGPVDREITGILDFGDLTFSYRVANLAVGLAYAVLGTSDPVAAGAAVVSGYHGRMPLTEDELEALHPLVCRRLAISLTMSAENREFEPGEVYLSVSEKPFLDLLEHFVSIHPSFVTAVYRNACGMEPCRATTGIRDWLIRSGPFHPVVKPDPARSRVHFFDFSVGSEWDPMSLADPVVAAPQIKQALTRSGSDVGIGRYDEPRLVYLGDQFASGGGRVRRTIHLGLDLFQPAGSQVFAPIAGTVVSTRDNDEAFDYGPTVILKHEPLEGPVFYTLYGHLSRDGLNRFRPGDIVETGETIGALGATDENGGWVPHLHFQIIADLLDSPGNYPGVAEAGYRVVWKSLCPDPNLIVGIAQSEFPEAASPASNLLEARRTRLGPSLSVSYRHPLHIVRGSGAYLYSGTGRQYLDAVNNVPHVGHCHPHVVRAGRRQMGILNTNTRYLHETVVEYAERLTAAMPDPLRVVFFVNSGSEANDLALRMAFAHTGRRHMLVLDGAYHGNLSTLVGISPYKFDGPGGEGRPPTTHVASMPDVYRGQYRKHNAGRLYAEHVRETVAEHPIAAFMFESLLGCGGQIVLPDGYLDAAFRHVRGSGGICIADEVQVGLGRVGTHFWGFETQGVVPDIVTLGKPIGNGHPLGAVVTTPEIATSFATGMEYFNTFGGNPVSCSVGMAVLDVIEQERLQENALRVGGYMRAGLEELAEGHQVIGDVRGLGLFLGVELVRNRETLEPAADEADYVINRMSEEGVLISTDGPLHNVLKIKPPMVFSKENADRLVETLDRVLGEDYVRAKT